MIQLKNLSLIMLSLSLVGCATQGPATPAERERAREVLYETSPRNLNALPKAVPEFKTSIPVGMGKNR